MGEGGGKAERHTACIEGDDFMDDSGAVDAPNADA